MISLYDILEASNGQLFGEPAAHIFTSLCFDSRQAAEAQLFVALKTDRGDTHQFMQEAVQRGCTGLLCSHPPDFDTEGISVIIVRDTEAALMNWTRHTLHRLGMQVVCVAGTSGKSLAVEAISRILATQYNVHRSSGLATGRLELAMTMSLIASEQQFIVLELDVTRPGEMNEIVQIVQPDVVVIPSISQARMDAFGDLDEIIAENRLLMDRLSSTSLAVLNLDDDAVRTLLGATRGRVLTFGIESFGADLIAYNVVTGLDKTGFDLRYGSERQIGRWTPWLGKHQLVSVMAALCVGLHYDIGLEDGLRAITEMPYLPGRMNPLNGINNSLLIDDSSSATPLSMLTGLNWLESINQQFEADKRHRLFFVMGDMDNLGAYSSLAHRTVGQRAAQVVDVIITEGIDAALAGRAALDTGIDANRVCMTYSTQDAVSILRDRYQLTENDVVLITGGPSSRMELVVSALLRDEADRAMLPRQIMLDEPSVLAQPSRLNWVELDLDALANNVKTLKQQIGQSVTLMSVVKADAYGHGAVTVARTALLNGADYLAVSSINEALILREAGIEAPILLLNYTPVNAVRQAIRQNLTLTLYDLDLARAYERVAREIGYKLRIHIKIDTGMGRLGVLPKETTNLFRYLLNMRFLEIEGIYTHFASSDEDMEYTAFQAKVLRDLLRPLRAAGFSFRYVHAANSAGTLASKDFHFNMVRVGLAMYGLSPSELMPLPAEFRPVLSWKTVIAQVKTLPDGHPVGYGRTYYTQGEERIAIIPVGYADGFRRAPQNWGEVLVHGQRAPVVGRVSMEKAAINVSHISNVSIGDEVVLLGRQGNEVLTAEAIAARIGTINYEVVTGILPRVPRL